MLTLREKHEYEQEIAQLKVDLEVVKVELFKVRKQRNRLKQYRKNGN